MNEGFIEGFAFQQSISCIPFCAQTPSYGNPGKDTVTAGWKGSSISYLQESFAKQVIGQSSLDHRFVWRRE
jgi:hypothetical protein